MSSKPRENAPHAMGEHQYRDDILQRLRADRPALQRMGVRSLALFGSVARGEGEATSDLDLLVEFDRPVGLFQLAELEDHLKQLLNVPRVDLVLRRAVLPELREEILSEAIDALESP